jgi:hypothetical protein
MAIQIIKSRKKRQDEDDACIGDRFHGSESDAELIYSEQQPL